MQAYLAHFVISKEKGRMTSSLLKNKMCQISLHARLFGTLEYSNKDKILLEGVTAVQGGVLKFI